MPARTRSRPAPPQPASVRDLVEGVGAGCAGVLAMAAISAAGLAVTGLAHGGSLVSLTAAATALAGGGSVGFHLDTTLGGQAGGRLPGGFTLGLSGHLSLMPLGISGLGALVLLTVLCWPLRRRGPLSPGALILRGAAAAACVLVLLGVAAAVGHGSLHLHGRGGSGGVGLPGLGRRPGGTGNGGDTRVHDAFSQASGAQYSTSVASTLGHVACYLLLLLVLCWLGTRRLVVRGRDAPLRAALHPVCSAIGRLACIVVLAGPVLGLLLLALPRGHKLAGPVLVGLPNLLVAAVSLGLGVPWHLTAGGVLSDRVLTRLQDHFPGNDNGTWTFSLTTLGHGHGGVIALLLALALTALLLLAVLAARRTPPDARAGATLRAARAGARLGGLLAILLPILTAAAHAAGTFAVGILGFHIDAVTASVNANGGLALLVGLLTGTLAGALGSLLLDATRAVFQPSRSRADRLSRPTASRRTR